MKKKLIIIGTGSTGRNIFNIVEKYKSFKIIGFAVDERYINNSNSFCGKPVYSIEYIQKHYNKNKILLFVAIQWNQLNKDRRNLYEQLKTVGFNFATIIAPSAIIHNECVVGDNCWIADNVVIEANSKIGNNTFVKVGALIAHYVTIEEHCFIGACSVIGGKSKIGKQTFVGISATIYDDVNIGEKCLVGANSVVKRDLPSYSSIRTTDVSQIYQYNDNTIEEKLLANYRKM